MNRTKSILLSLAVVVALVVPMMVLGACGPRPNCDDCETEQTCEAEFLCYWDVDECLEQTITPVSSGDITTTASYVSGLFTDAKLLILLAVGVPLAFWIIKRSVAIAPK